MGVKLLQLLHIGTQYSTTTLEIVLRADPVCSKLPFLPILIQKTLKSAVCSKLFSPTQRLFSTAIFLQQVSTCVILTLSPLTHEYYCWWIFFRNVCIHLKGKTSEATKNTISRHLTSLPPKFHPAQVYQLRQFSGSTQAFDE